MSNTLDSIKSKLVAAAGVNPITADLLAQACALEGEVLTAVKNRLPVAKLQELEARAKACLTEAEQHLHNFEGETLSLVSVTIEDALKLAKDELAKAVDVELANLLHLKSDQGVISAMLDHLVYQIKVFFGVVK